MLLFLSFSAASSGTCLPVCPTEILAEETCSPSKIGSRAPTLLARRRKQEAKPRCRRRWRQPQASEKGDPPKSGAVANRKIGATLAAAVPPTHTHYYLFDVFFYYFPWQFAPKTAISFVRSFVTLSTHKNGFSSPALLSSVHTNTNCRLLSRKTRITLLPRFFRRSTTLRTAEHKIA
uniref:(northern house mosquito) hypothetical protein n=1 Tax=Culex pipiens TaxID=7175 RepID=A0A8D8L3J1_CULPI